MSFIESVIEKNKHLSKILDSKLCGPNLVDKTLGLNIFVNAILINIEFIDNYHILKEFSDLIGRRYEVLHKLLQIPSTYQNNQQLIRLDIELCYSYQQKLMKKFAKKHPIEYVEQSKANPELSKYKNILRHPEFIEWVHLFLDSCSHNNWINSDQDAINKKIKDKKNNFTLVESNGLEGYLPCYSPFVCPKWRKKQILHIVDMLKGIYDPNENSNKPFDAYKNYSVDDFYFDILLNISKYLKDVKTITAHIKKMYLDKIINTEEFCFKAFF